MHRGFSLDEAFNQVARPVQEGGWPLGLQPLNARIGLVRNVDYSGSVSFTTTLITASPSSSSSFSCSSDQDSESTGSFLQDSSIITLGSLIGILDLSNRPTWRSRQPENSRVPRKKNHKAKAWLSLCSKAQLSGKVVNAGPSLGHFLKEERRASNVQEGRNYDVSITYQLHRFSQNQSAAEPNSLFSNNGIILPPPGNEQSRTVICDEHVRKQKSKPEEGFCRDGNIIARGATGVENGHCLALMFPCMSGQATE